MQTTLISAPEPRCANAERRGDPRHFVDAAVSCRPVGDNAAPNLTGRVRDVSTLGIGLVLPEPIEPGVLLDIDLINNRGNWVGAVRGRVVHNLRTSDGVWIIGCAFVSELDDAELRFFDAQRLRPVMAESRRWVRFPCNVETVCYTCETVPGERRKAYILDISAGGVGMSLPCEFSPGTVLRLELPARSSLPARLLLIRVIHCVEAPGRGWIHGCEFADQLGTEELSQLRP
ncbi:MAG: PilZ domain-containing protein [Gemmataceae bacterium]